VLFHQLKRAPKLNAFACMVLIRTSLLDYHHGQSPFGGRGLARSHLCFIHIVD
jgi:phosphatidylserine decarboxylase